MSHFNPKKEFTISFPIDKVKEAINKLIASESDIYSVVSESKALGQIRIHKKGFGFDLGYDAEFDLQKVSDTETKVTIEMMRHIGTITSSHEMSMSSEYLNEITTKFGAILEGNIDPSTGRANIPKPSGCLVFIIAGIAYILYQLL